MSKWAFDNLCITISKSIFSAYTTTFSISIYLSICISNNYSCLSQSISSPLFIRSLYLFFISLYLSIIVFLLISLYLIAS